MLRTGALGIATLILLQGLQMPGAAAQMAPEGPGSAPSPRLAPEAQTLPGEPTALPEEPTGVAEAPKPADTPQVVEARGRIKRAEALFDAENYDAALVEFEKSYELLAGHPLQAELLYNIALCHERRFHYAEAMRLYARYMQEAGASGDARAEVEATVRTLSNLLASVDIRSNVPAEIWVDDNLVGTAPGRVLVPGGRHTLELRATGRESQKREIRIAARETQTLDIPLAALDKGLRPVWFYSTLGATVVTAIVGVSFAAKLKSEHGDFAESGTEAALNRPSDEEHLQALALRADIFFATSGVLAITSAVLALFTDFEQATEPPPVTTSARLMLAPGGLGLEGSF